MKVELKIDRWPVEIDQKANIAMTHSIADIEEPESTSAGYTKSIEIPLTPNNMRVFRFTNELFSKEQFNNGLHTAEYLVDGMTVMSGIAQIDKITYNFDNVDRLAGGSFHVSVIGAAYEWITRAKKPLNELESDETVVYNMEEVYNNSIRADTTLVKFFPVDRGAFWEEDLSGALIPRKRLDIRDYHPFFNVWKTLELIFAGYKVQSSLQSLMKNLYCSGSVKETEDLSYIQEENDFDCGTRFDNGDIIAEKTPVNIFNLWTGEKYFGDKVLRIENGTTRFSPLQKLHVIFDVQVTFCAKVYSGEYYRPIFLDQFLFGKRGNLQNDYFRKIALSFEESEEYGMLADFDPNLEYEAGMYIFRITGISRDQYEGLYIETNGIGGGSYAYMGLDSFATFTTVKDGKIRFLTRTKTDYDLFPLTNIEGASIEIVKADYLTFGIQFKTLPMTITAGGKFYFSCEFRWQSSIDATRLEGYVEAASISPKIGNYLGIEDEVGISTIASDVSQLDWLAALRQMFNLLFYTNPLTKEVFIEPRTKFFNLDRASVVDWRGKIDYSQPMELEELGRNVGKTFKLSYADGNEVIGYYNWKNKRKIGSYTVSLLNKTSDETTEIVNPIFSAFLTHKVNGMTLLQEEREGEQKTLEDVEISLTPVIGCFKYVIERTAGDDIASFPKYPLLVFQDTTKGVNLGFDAFNDLLGLGKYYGGNISAYNYGRRVTMYLKLSPQDVEAIQFPNVDRQDFRGVFLLNFDGEDVPCLLESIEDYNPAGASTKCVFISDPNIRLTGKDLVIITFEDVAISRENLLIGYK